MTTLVPPRPTVAPSRPTLTPTPEPADPYAPLPPRPQWEWRLTLEAVIQYLERQPHWSAAGVCGNLHRCVVAQALATLCDLSGANPGLVETEDIWSRVTWFGRRGPLQHDVTLQIPHTYALRDFINAFDKLGRFNDPCSVEEALAVAYATRFDHFGSEGMVSK